MSENNVSKLFTIIQDAIDSQKIQIKLDAIEKQARYYWGHCFREYWKNR